MYIDFMHYKHEPEINIPTSDGKPAELYDNIELSFSSLILAKQYDDYIVQHLIF